MCESGESEEATEFLIEPAAPDDVPKTSSGGVVLRLALSEGFADVPSLRDFVVAFAIVLTLDI
jgi:hypothetical protein